MHSEKRPVRRPSLALVIGLVFVVIAIVYWAVPYFGGWELDMAGTVMLGALGIAMGLMFYVLMAGSPSAD